MTPTSNERREVAERLRKAHGIMKFVDALGIDLDSDWAWTDVSKRVVLSCGHVADMVTDRPPAFCPKCGARVVDDVDGEDE